MEDLPLTCDCGCKETEERNVYKDDINGIFTTVEYDEHCKGCGRCSKVCPFDAIKMEV